ncbi:hypothetical protein DUI87_29532 [Hirundo rustica rustica]|uniref:Uncharacterized protein n=1 Tax=Hirundo rustica rustica TaxID=333673 RepID=A0A3M0J163_HIRRU|nr:hypothetical protein DUI87_29532 [Hirundo rustica rustica]
MGSAAAASPHGCPSAKSPVQLYFGNMEAKLSSIKETTAGYKASGSVWKNWRSHTLQTYSCSNQLSDHETILDSRSWELGYPFFLSMSSS